MRVFRFSSVLVFASACFLFSMARAAIVSDDFNDGNDQGWTHYEPLAPLGAGGTFTFPGGAYRLQAAISPDQATLGPGRAGSLRLDGVYTDFFISVDIVDWDDTADQAFGVLSRIRELGLGTTDGYGFLYVPGDGDIEIERFDNEVDDNIGITDLILDPARDYRLTFAGLGNSFTGEVFDLADLTTPLITLTAIDDAYTSGVAGLLVADASPSSGGAVSDATFDNYYGVPEPTSLVLLLGGSFLISRRAGRGRA